MRAYTTAQLRQIYFFKERQNSKVSPQVKWKQSFSLETELKIIRTFILFLVLSNVSY